MARAPPPCGDFPRAGRGIQMPSREKIPGTVLAQTLDFTARSRTIVVHRRKRRGAASVFRRQRAEKRRFLRHPVRVALAPLASRQGITLSFAAG